MGTKPLEQSLSTGSLTFGALEAMSGLRLREGDFLMGRFRKTQPQPASHGSGQVTDARLHVCLCVPRFLLLGLGLGPGSRPKPCASAPLVSPGFPSSVHLTSKEAALLRAPARVFPRPAVTDAAATP